MYTGDCFQSEGTISDLNDSEPPVLMNLIVLCSTMMNAPKLVRVRFQVRRRGTVLLFTLHPTRYESD